MVPVLQALLVADRIYRLANNGGMVIAGTINELFLVPPPESKEIESADGLKQTLVQARHPTTPSAYISLTDVHDDTELRLQLVSLSENRVLLHTKFNIEKGNRLGTIEIVAPMPPFDVIQSPGAYAIEIVCDDEILGMHRIQVVKEDTNNHGENKQ